MKKRVIAVCAFAFVTGCMKHPPPPDPGITARHNIQLLFDRWKTAFEAKDVNGVMAMYAPGATLTAYDVVPPLQFKGADEYRKDYSNFFAQFDGPIHVDLADTHIEAGPSAAFAYGLERLTGKLKDGTPVDMWLRYTEGLKDSNGQWRVVHEHISVPVDLTTGKARTDLKP
jgi:ketosteroid isomerase-like protein